MGGSRIRPIVKRCPKRRASWPAGSRCPHSRWAARRPPAVYGDAIIFKLSPDGVVRALELCGAGHFDPRGGRPMREWIQVPDEQSSPWIELSQSALEYALGQKK